MRKLAIGFSLSTILLAAIAAVLRYREINTIFDPVTGLARTAPISIILIAFSVFSVVVFFLFVSRLRGYTEFPSYERAFKTNSPVAMVLSFILAVLMIYASYTYYIYAKTLESSTADSILAVFAALSGISYLTLSINTFRRKGGPEMPLCCFIIVIFICYWLILTYKLKAADPVILDYVYDALALCSAALATYYITGFCYNRGSPIKTLFFANLTVYLSLVALVGAQPLSIKLFYGFTASIMLINSVTLILNLKKLDVNSEASDNEEPIGLHSDTSSNKIEDTDNSSNDIKE